jgi:hypothetical protein
MTTIQEIKNGKISHKVEYIGHEDFNETMKNIGGVVSFLLDGKEVSTRNDLIKKYPTLNVNPNRELYEQIYSQVKKITQSEDLSEFYDAPYPYLFQAKTL